VLATTVDEIRAAVSAGRFVAMMGIEGGHIIEESLPALRMFHALGVRYMTLTHSFHTSWADSAGTRDDVEPLHGGLTPFGVEVVHEMNRLGMMVDVSHVADDTFWDVIDTSRAPVIASHSSVRAVADHRRNMSDEMLEALAEKGGVVMINFYPAYIDEGASEATKEWFARNGAEMKRIFGELPEGAERRAAYRELMARDPAPSVPLSTLLDHFDHAIEVAGADHVGIGADWDGVPSMPEGMEDVSKLPALTAGLLERGHSQATVRKVLGENLLRVLEEVERVARRIEAGG
jgi:membrane dipeptidase